MHVLGWGIVAFALVFAPACSGDDDATASGDGTTSTTGDVDGTGGGTGDGDGDGDGDGGASGTLSPLVCQADLTILREETFEVFDPPLAYDGEFYGFRDVDGQLQLRALVEDAAVARDGQVVAGFPDPLIFGLSAREIATAPDLGVDNAPDDPVAFIIQSGMLRSDGADELEKVTVEGDIFEATSGTGTLTGTVDSFVNLEMGTTGELVYQLRLQGDSDVYLIEASPDGSFTHVFNQGAAVDETFSVLSIDEVTPVNVGMLVRTTLTDGGGTSGSAYFHHTAQSGLVCVRTDVDADCERGLVVSEGLTVAVDDFYSDGTTTAAIARNTPDPELHYRIGDGQPGVLRRGETVQGIEFNNFHHPRACARDGSVYFAGQVFDNSGTWEEVFRLSADGAITQITDFGQLVADDALTGEVPDEILNMALGHGCDVVIRARGETRSGETAPYEGYWLSYDGDITVEIVDETPGRADNGNGAVTGLTRSRTGIDSNARPIPVANVGPAGDLALALQIPNGAGQDLATYARATKPDCGD